MPSRQQVGTVDARAFSLRPHLPSLGGESAQPPGNGTRALDTNEPRVRHPISWGEDGCLPPARLSAEELVPLQVWVTEHDVPPADLIDRAGEVLLSLPVRIGRLEMEYPAS